MNEKNIGFSDGKEFADQREAILHAAGIRAMLCAARGLSESQACQPPGCETSLLRAGVRAGFAQAPAPAPALGAFSGESGDTEAKNG